MSSSLEPSSSCSKQETPEVMSNYAESIIDDYDVFDPEELRNEQMFEKPRGERRWLGKEHHRGKERLHNSVKDRTYIEKTVKSTEPLSKNSTKKIIASTKDGLEFNVIYSLDKRNRWETTDKVSLLGTTPENVNAEVVEKNSLDMCGLFYPNSSTFAVHSKQIDFEKEPGDFEIKSATSSGKGQHYSNFLQTSREFSKKANARTMTIRGEETSSEKQTDSQPTISYNIYKSHPSQQVVGKHMFVPKVASKSVRHRASKKVEMDDYDEDENYFDEEDESFNDSESRSPAQSVLDFSNLAVGSRDKQTRSGNRKDSELSYEMIDSVESRAEFTDLLNIHDYLHNEGFMFEEAVVTFHNQKDNIEHQVEMLREENKLIVKELRHRQYLIDVSEWCQLEEAVKDGETTTVIAVTHLRKNVYNILVNSTIPSHPSKRGSDYLKKQISSATTIREAISRITSEILTHRKVVETMKISSLFYGRKTVPELLQICSEWENQLVNMQWPNQHYHSTWANSVELSQVGGKLEWNDLCTMVKKEKTMDSKQVTDGECGLCSQKKLSHELFLVEDETKIKCTECLREEFYRELRGKRLPIDLQIIVADELDSLATFIPLAVLNLYIRMVSETIYKDLGATGDFEKCPSCKSAVFFEEVPSGNEKKSQNRSCPCGYSWCKQCDRVPHWPMKCGEYAEWEEKWLLRYAMTHAQGSGTHNLLEVSCQCSKQIFNVLLPEEYMKCPGCKITVDLETLETVWKRHYFPFRPRYRKLVREGHIYNRDYNQNPFFPKALVYTPISKIPVIRTSVIEICGVARDIRYDIHSRNRAVNREHILIRKKVMEREVVENLLGTSVYLVENVTAWMYMSSQYDRNVKKNLESVMENRKNLLSSLDGEDSEAISECINKLRKDINNVVTAVEKMIVTVGNSQN
ncbi:hypothetical protein GCK72_018490 [Caenorhabditis remanei]|uniref:IBR domain-containing protein n=1 Tax=Caenorhabditis remanei TaxID=31234 RepID=A0A6A5GAU6_CAERE|nr:hypothetical protein GCK72_018490 [Caenorhabditis remanei]KAF1751936.1 hypothetical protein GCK72_018490 [Caenorhabditis remanei]